jgi:predicted DNA-binding ribbon-helix-helix protein
MSRLERRSFSLAGHRTSVALEPEFWEVLRQIAELQGGSLAQLIVDADSDRLPHQGLASTLRLLALRSAKAR